MKWYRYIATSVGPLVCPVNTRLSDSLEIAIENNDPQAFLAAITPENIHDLLNEDGTRPVHAACRFVVHSDVLRVLLVMGADIDAQSSYGTPLHHCVNMGNTEGLKLLLTGVGQSVGRVVANPNCTDPEGRSPLRLACEMLGKQWPDGFPMVQLLLDLGVYPCSAEQSGDGLGVAFFAYMNGSAAALTLIADSDKTAFMKTLHPIHVLNTQNRSFWETYLKVVPQDDLAEALYDFVDPDDGQTVFHLLAIQNNADGLASVLEILKNREDIAALMNRPDDEGLRPIDYAVEFGSLALVERFLAEAVDLDEGSSGKSPLFLALWYGKPEAFRLISSRMIASDVLTKADLPKMVRSVWDARMDAVLDIVPEGESLLAAYRENPKAFNTTSLTVGIQKLNVSDKKKAALRDCKRVLAELKKIICH